ncbi:MAG: hypothetical protein U0V72_12370 [Cytophagales bacterium]
MYKLPLFFLSLLFLNSCSFHSGNVSSGSTVDCPRKGIVIGTSKTFNFLGLGGNNNAGLILNAKKDLYGKIREQKGIIVSNFSVDFKRTYFLLFISSKATVSADIYDCNKSYSDPSSLSEILKNPQPDIVNQGFKKDNKVKFVINNKYFDGQINYLSKSKRVLVDYVDNNGSNSSKWVNINNIFNSTPSPDNKEIYGYDLEEKLQIKISSKSTGSITTTPCTVIGLNLNTLLVKYIGFNGKEKIAPVNKTLFIK